MKKIKISIGVWAVAILVLLGFTFREFFFGTPHTASNRWVIGPGEYFSGLVDKSNGKLYQLVDQPTHFTNVPDSFVDVAGGAHHMLALTVGGRVAAWGDNQNGELGIGSLVNQVNPVFITTDSLGVQFGNVKKIMAGGTIGWNSFALKNDGTLWGWGDLSAGTRGNNTFGGQTTRPVQIPFPTGTVIVDFSASFFCLALDNAGNVWTWGAEGAFNNFGAPYILAQGTSTPNSRVPTKQTYPAGVIIKQIAGGGAQSSWALGTNGHVYGWAYDLTYAGVTNTNKNLSNFGFNAIDLTDTLGLPTTIDTLITNSMFTLAILSDSTIWGWGSNACANAGFQGINYRLYRTPSGVFAPYAWSQGRDEAMQIRPVQIMKGKHNFTKIFGSVSLNYWFNAEDVHDSLYMWGRNKGGVGGNLIGGVDSVAGDIQALYPNNWDVNNPTYINPFGRNYIIRTTCQLFKDTTGAQLQLTYPLNTSGSAPTVSAGSTQTISTSYTVLKGSYTVTSPARGAYNVLWQNTGRPAGAPIPLIPLIANDTVPVSNLTVIGAYTFTYTVQDNNFKTSTASVTINVTAGGASSYFTKRRGAFRNFKNSH